jgi:hypothetical protein
MEVTSKVPYVVEAAAVQGCRFFCAQVFKISNFRFWERETKLERFFRLLCQPCANFPAGS